MVVSLRRVITFARMPFVASSWANALANMIMPVFAALYGDDPGKPRFAANDEMNNADKPGGNNWSAYLTVKKTRFKFCV